MLNNEPKSENQSGTRKPYEPPALVTISLRPEEAVLGSCKNHATGPVHSSCAYLGGCYPVGS